MGNNLDLGFMGTENSETVYHYTSIESAFHILGGSSPSGSKKTIRLSSSESLNDRNEIKEFSKLFDSELALLSIEEQTAPETSRAIDWIKELLNFFQHRCVFYIASFSLDEDSLSQWRAYGDDANGVAIGLNLDKIIESSNKKGYNSIFGPTFKVECVYSPSDSKRKLTEILNRAKTYAQSHRVGTSYNNYHTFFYELIKCMCSFKNEAFLEEKEVRLVRVQSLNDEDESSHLVISPEFKVTSYGIHSFIELEIPDDAVEALMIGPKSSLAKDSIDLNRFLKAAKCVNLAVEDIHISKASYR